jgi:hypothetical protein
MTSDRGSPFVSQLAATIYKQLGIKQIRTTAFHAQSNGIVESFNKTMKSTLRLWCNEEQSDWDILLCFAIFAYNTSIHGLLLETPFYLQYGRDARVLTDITIGKIPESYNDTPEYALTLAQRLYDVHTRVVDIYKQVNDERIDANAELMNDFVPFKVGDEVFLFDPTTVVGRSRKLVRRWVGPYTVLEQLSPVNYKIIRNGQSQVVHIERLRKRHTYNNDEIASDLQIAQDELQSLEQLQKELLIKKKSIEDNKQRLQAQVLVNQGDNNHNQQLDNNNVNVVCMYIKLDDDINWN